MGNDSQLGKFVVAQQFVVSNPWENFDKFCIDYVDSMLEYAGEYIRVVDLMKEGNEAQFDVLKEMRYFSHDKVCATLPEDLQLKAFYRLQIAADLVYGLEKIREYLSA